MPLFFVVMAVLGHTILLSFNSFMGPIYNAGTGDCNDSIKRRSFVSASGWCIDWALVGVREGQEDGSAGRAWMHAHAQTHVHTYNLLSNLLQISAQVLLAPVTAAVG